MSEWPAARELSEERLTQVDAILANPSRYQKHVLKEAAWDLRAGLEWLRIHVKQAEAAPAELRGRLGETEVEWGADHGSLGVLYASADEASVRLHCARNGREIRRRIVGEWMLEDGTWPPPVCRRCGGDGKVPDWSNWNTEYGEPRPKPCPDCAADQDNREGGDNG